MSEQRCHHCCGTGHDQGGKCLSCRGTGVWPGEDAVRAALAEFYEAAIEASNEQDEDRIYCWMESARFSKAVEDARRLLQLGPAPETLQPEQRESRPSYEDHVAETTTKFGRHSDTSCPPGTRAMCSYKTEQAES